MAALSKSVWRVVSAKASAMSSATEAWPRATVTAKAAIRAARTRSTAHIARRWSTRSATAPPSSPNSNHGR